MTDTSPTTAARMNELWMALPPSERLVCGALMFDAAREMILASFPAGLSSEETHRRLYQRVYGRELPADFFTRKTET